MSNKHITIGTRVQFVRDVGDTNNFDMYARNWALKGEYGDIVDNALQDMDIYTVEIHKTAQTKWGLIECHRDDFRIVQNNNYP